MDEYKVFVSRSFDPVDAQVVNTVLDFCRAVGFTPIRTERASRSLPREKIRDAIAEARVFIGILTVDPDREFTTKEWLVTEIGMAEFANLPILLFIEEGVKYEPAHHITSYAHFRRDDLPALWQSVVQSLVELREDSRVLWGSTSAETEQPYRFLVDDVLIEIGEDGTLRHERHLEVQSLISSLRALRPIEKIITSSRLLGYHDSVFDFRPGPGSPEMNFEVRSDNPKDVSYQVGFESPLSHMETASFTVVHTSRGSVPLTREQVELTRPGVYVSVGDIARQGHAVKAPTDSLSLLVRFPDAYRISECSPQVVVTLRDRVGESNTVQAELDRIRQGFRVRHNRLELEVEFPKLDHAYYFTWRPPTASAVPQGMVASISAPD